MTPEQYEAAMARIDELMDAQEGTPEAEELSRLADLANAYEQDNFPIEEYTCTCIDVYGEDPFCKFHGDRRNEASSRH